MIGTKQPQMEFRSINTMHEKTSRNYGLARNNETKHYAHRSIDRSIFLIHQFQTYGSKKKGNLPDHGVILTYSP